MGSKLGALGEEIGPMLMKFLAKAEAGGRAAGAVGKGAMDALPGLIDANPKTAAAISGLLGLGGGMEAESIGQPDEDEIRNEDDLKWMKRLYGE